MEEKLVSIITTCYNGEKFLTRYFESILSQTYKNIEVIFINDGSDDKTEEIVKKYVPKLEKEGIKLEYIYQDNSGQAVAINKALNIFNGDFLAFLDSDDTIDPTSIQKKVKFLIEKDEYGLVRTKGKIIDEVSKNVIGHFEHKSKQIKENIFDDLIMEHDIWIANGCYMIKREALINSIPTRKIYEHRGGQNWQILLPITNKYKCGYINEDLFTYYMRTDSHSHTGSSFSEIFDKYTGHQEILTEILKELEKYETYKKRLVNKYAKIKLRLAQEYGEKKVLTEELKVLIKNGTCNLIDIFVFIIGMIGGKSKCYKI